MAIQHFTGNNNYNVMACHVFALSGDPATANAINARYAKLGDYLIGVAALPQNNQDIPNGLSLVSKYNILTVKNIVPHNGAANNNVAGLRQATLNLLCLEFGLVVHAGSGIRLWGHFEDGQWLPEHMYVTYGGNIYDTMPNAPIRKNVNDNGKNPPSYGEGHELDAGVIFSIEVQALAAGTMAVINTPANQWANGMG